MRYERITFIEKPQHSAKTLILRVTKETDVLLFGVEVDKGGDAVVKRNAKGEHVDETQHIISKDLLTRRTELVMNNTYGWLERKR